MSEQNPPTQVAAKQIASEQASADRIYAIASTLAVIAGIFGGFWLLGSPNKQRLINLDQERVQNLRTIAREIRNETSGSGPESDYDEPLPEQLSDNIRNRGYAQDPVTGEVYEYNRLSDDAYELCATFATSTESEAEARRAQGYRYNSSDNWLHPEGRHCYEIERNATEPQG